jgi:hypothetical protein
MIRTQVYLTEEQARDIKLRAKREKKREAEVIRELLSQGLKLNHPVVTKVLESHCCVSLQLEERASPSLLAC